MALYVSTNVSSLNSQYKLRNATSKLDVNYQRLGSGRRINTAKDDASGLMISNDLASQIKGFDQGNRNTDDGIALAQTIDGALSETVSMLQRMRTLAVQAANGTYTNEDRQTMQIEMNNMCTEISRIAEKTTFAGALVLDGAGNNSLIPDDGNVKFQVGANSNDIISVDMSDPYHLKGIADQANVDAVAAQDATSTNTDFRGFVQTTVDGKDAFRWALSTADAAQLTLANIDSFITAVDTKRTQLGAVMNRMEATIRNYSVNSDNHSDSRSRIRDTDFASETASLTQNNIIQQASQTILSQSNQAPAFAISLLQR